MGVGWAGAWKWGEGERVPGRLGGSWFWRMAAARRATSRAPLAPSEWPVKGLNWCVVSGEVGKAVVRAAASARRFEGVPLAWGQMATMGSVMVAWAWARSWARVLPSGGRAMES